MYNFTITINHNSYQVNRMMVAAISEKFLESTFYSMLTAAQINDGWMQVNTKNGDEKRYRMENGVFTNYMNFNINEL